MGNQWKDTDDAANSVLWGPSQLKNVANSTTRDALFGNTSADAYFTGTTIGTYGVDDAEMNYDRWTVLSATPGANLGSAVIITADANGQFTANGTGSTNAIINVETIQISDATVNTGGNNYVAGDIVASDEGEATTLTRFVIDTVNAVYGDVLTVSIIDGGEFANGSDVPAGDIATSALTGSGTGLTLEIETGVRRMSLADAGSYTANPGASLTLTGGADQTDANVQVGLTMSKFGAKESVTHAGHVLVTQGTGGRAGRIQTETLVTVSAMTGDSDDTLFPNT